MTTRRIRGARLAAALLIASGLLVSPRAASAGTIDGVQWLQNITYGEDRGPLLLDAFLPEEPGANRPAVIYVHGGGWRWGSKHVCLNEGCVELAQMGWVAFSVNYDLDTPRWPNQLSDLQQAITFVRQNASTYGVDPDKIGLIGSSSGGNLAALAGTTGSGALTSGSRARAVVTWSAPLNLEPMFDDPLDGCSVSQGSFCNERRNLPGLVEGFTGCSPQACPDTFEAASPADQVDSSDPAMLLANSTQEVIPLDQASGMAALLQDDGVPTQLVEISGSAHADEYQAMIWPDTVAWLEQWIGTDRTATPPDPGRSPERARRRTRPRPRDRKP